MDSKKIWSTVQNSYRGRHTDGSFTSKKILKMRHLYLAKERARDEEEHEKITWMDSDRLLAS
jgi:hypothetical protein